MFCKVTCCAQAQWHHLFVFFVILAAPDTQGSLIQMQTWWPRFAALRALRHLITDCPGGSEVGARRGPASGSILQSPAVRTVMGSEVGFSLILMFPSLEPSPGPLLGQPDSWAVVPSSVQVDYCRCFYKFSPTPLGHCFKKVTCL